MGQRMPDEPIEYGNDCGVCFLSGETPKFVYARFSNVIACPPKNGHVCITAPNDRMFALEQDPLHACHYEYVGSTWELSYWHRLPADPFGRLELGDKAGFAYFWSSTPPCPDEGLVLHNSLVDCGAFQCGKLGIAVITWSPQATNLLLSINMAKANDLFMELRPLDNGNLVYKFCNLSEITNIKILFEP